MKTEKTSSGSRRSQSKPPSKASSVPETDHDIDAMLTSIEDLDLLG